MTLKKDVCPDGDFSPSYYDKECGTRSEEKDAEADFVERLESSEENNEVNAAYQWAFANGITTLAPLKNADPE
jgi:hypothetical protein